MDSIIGRLVATILTLILIAGVGFIAYNGFQQNKVSTMTAGISSLVESIQQDYSQYPSFAGLSTMPVNSLSSVKNLWGNSAGTVGTAGGLLDPWGNDVTVTSGATPPTGATNVTAANMVITDTGTSFGASECKTMAMAGGASAYETVVGGTMVNTVAGGSINPVTAATACAGGAKAIAWVFGH